MTAGQKRKFYRNMQYGRSARTLAVLGVHLMALAGPIALVVLGVLLGMALSNHHGAHQLATNHHQVSFAFLGSLAQIRELREKRGKAAADAQALIPKVGEKWTAEARQKFDAFMTEADTLKTQIDALQADVDREARAAATSRETGGVPRLPESPIGGPEQLSAVTQYRTALKKHRTKALETIRPEARVVVEELNRRYWEALKDYLTCDPIMGMRNPESRDILAGKDPAFRELVGRAPKMQDQEVRDLGVGTGSLGGFFVPQGFVYDIEEALKYYGDMLNVAEVMDTATGQPLPYPTDNDTTNTGEIVGEGQQVSDADVSIGHIVFGAFKFSTKMVKVSIELLQDSAFDLESYLKKKFAIRLGRILNTKFTVGAGTTEPLGIITAIVANDGTPNATPGQAYGIPLIASGSAANDGSGNTGTNSIGSGDLFNLEHTVDPLYRRGAKYMLHDQTLRFIKTLLDKYGRPLWIPGLAMDAPDTINGYEYSINNDMATIAASANTVAFGSLDKYLIRRVKELAIVRLSERFADYGQVAFIGFARYDGNLLDAGTHPVSYLQQHS